MCGIFGIIKPRKLHEKVKIQSVISEAFYCNVLRGEDGSGVFGVPFKNPKDAKVDSPTVFKRGLAGYDFVNLKQYDKFFNDEYKYKYIVGHNRATTRGKVSNANSHPFTHGSITLVHNGTVVIPKEFLGGNDFAVDSDGLTYALANHGIDVLKKAVGGMALVWFDESTNKLHMIRNKQKPLGILSLEYHGQGNSVTHLQAFASEPKMMEWLVGRNGFVCKGIAWIKPDVLYTYVEEDPDDIKVESEPFELSQDELDYSGRVAHFTNRNYNQSVNYSQQTLPNLPAKNDISKKEREALEEYVNDDVSFSYSNYFPYSKNDTHGRLEGNFLRPIKYDGGSIGYVNTRVTCYNIPADIERVMQDISKKLGKSKWQLPFMGVVTGVGANGDLLIDSKSLGIKDVGFFTFERGNAIFTYAKEDVKENPPVVIPEMKGSPKSCYGPNNSVISPEAYYNLIKDGCVTCAEETDLTKYESKEIGWYNGNPMCPKCAKEWSTEEIQQVH